VQGGSAIPKRYDLPHGDFLKFFLFLLFLSLSLFFLSCLAPPEATFFFVPVLTFANISPLTNIRRIFLNIQNYIRKVTFSRATKLLRGESIFFEEAYDFFIFSIAIVSSRLAINNSPSPSPVDYSHLVIIAKSAETQKRDTNVAGRI